MKLLTAIRDWHLVYLINIIVIFSCSIALIGDHVNLERICQSQTAKIVPLQAVAQPQLGKRGYYTSSEAITRQLIVFLSCLSRSPSTYKLGSLKNDISVKSWDKLWTGPQHLFHQHLHPPLKEDLLLVEVESIVQDSDTKTCFDLKKTYIYIITLKWQKILISYQFKIWTY